MVQPSRQHASDHDSHPPLITGAVVIRRYRPGKDGNWLRKLPGEGQPHDSARGDDVSSWVAVMDDRPVGVLTWRWLEPLEDARAVIARLWVEPAARRHGIGTALYRRGVSEIRKQFRKADLHLKTLIVEPGPHDEAGEAFCRSLKFNREADGWTRTL